MMDIIYLTKEKKEELKAELEEAKSVTHPRVIERVKSAKAEGDLSENADYHAARDEQSRLQAKINNLEHTLKNCEIIKKDDSGEVQIGSSIILENTKTKELKNFNIVSVEEADPLEGKISNKSPIGSSVFGKKMGGEIKVKTPKGEIKFIIKEVN